jgi:hypothetical protein
MFKNFRRAILLLSLCFANSSAATTVVYVVTPTGVVIGADGLLFPPAGLPAGADGLQLPGATVTKIFLLKKHLVVASLSSELQKSPDLTATLYDFQTWIKDTDKQTDAEISVTGLTEFIKNQMRTTFAYEIYWFETSKVTREQAPSFIDSRIVHYIIAGYEKGVPVAYSLTLDLNWETHFVDGPFQLPFKGSIDHKHDLSYCLFVGQQVGISRIFVEGTKEQKEYLARIPVESRILNRGKSESLTLKQASNVARALLGIEAEANPRFVGFPITVVTIPKVGNGWVRTYEKDVSTLSTVPKTTQGKQR